MCSSDLPEIGLIVSCAPDFQHNSQLVILSKQQKRYCFHVTANSLITSSIYFAVRHSLEASWLNDRDQFLYPNDGWKTDLTFQNDCLAFALFDGQNAISSTEGKNHWIPFTEQEVNAKEKFASNFMTDFINGKLKVAQAAQNTLFANDTVSGVYDNQPREFSPEAQVVFDAGRALWQY